MILGFAAEDVKAGIPPARYRQISFSNSWKSLSCRTENPCIVPVSYNFLIFKGK
jgi:hypothetical protein